MRRLIPLIATLALAACTFVADAQEGGRSGRSAQRTFDVGAFDAVSLAGAYDVEVRVGPAASVRAEGDEDELDRMEVIVRDGELRIGRRRGDRRGFSWRGDHGPVTVYVTVPTLRAASIAGAGDMSIDRVEGGAFAAQIAGAGDMRIASLRVERANFEIAGSGDLYAAGTAGEAKVSVAGSGDVDIGALESRDARIAIVGSGDVRTRALRTAQVSIMGSGDVTVRGPAKCSVSKLGSGEVRCEA